MMALNSKPGMARARLRQGARLRLPTWLHLANRSTLRGTEQVKTGRTLTT